MSITISAGLGIVYPLLAASLGACVGYFVGCCMGQGRR